MNKVTKDISGSLKDALEKYQIFIIDRFNECINLIHNILKSNKSDKIKIEGLQTLISFLNIILNSEKYDENNILKNLVNEIFNNEKNISDEIMKYYYDEYYTKYDDIKYYTLKYLRFIIENVSKKVELNENERKRRKIQNEYDIDRVVNFSYKLLTNEHSILSDDYTPKIFVF